ncbi:MAG: hypothetical protein KKH93_05785 [Candidatus Omnitrophica bacterium]|nr:hypothetical protein [Candidatus Omnitrophota bacterium]MBU2044953.1 hypothetical protein [Candidatus Omnitrophota bacterium]MBU2250808.1 hypothetical protein [Candidatus Omnitrophota bacterium]MBU2265918.1 hypothetical protein [Candidatus Omnitrophota bacterium]MBU2473543.1 hypothetical protein [Candidatus Omnitrophota bacterium]
MKKTSKAQSILESSVVFLAGSIIIGAAIGFFAQGVAHVPIRQATYEMSRVAAGTPNRQVDASGAQPTALQPLFPTYVVVGLE